MGSQSAALLLGGIARERLQAPAVRRLLVAVSGGMDSSALLHALARVKPGPPLHALHINHGLQAAAQDFAAACQSLCASLKVPLNIQQVQVAPGGSLEGRARQARYSAFASLLAPGDLLLLAHHADDQVETALFRLLRGSRVQGLQGMPRERPLGAASLYRPLLATRRAKIAAYVQQFQLPYVEDPSNQDESMDRNWLRHRLIPTLESRWPDLAETLLATLERDTAKRAARTASLLAKLRDLNGAQGLSARSGQPMQQGRSPELHGWQEQGAALPSSLPLAPLLAAPASEVQELIDAWLLSQDLPLMSQAALSSFASQYLPRAEGAFQFSALELRKHKGRLYLLRQLPPAEPYALPLTAGSHSLPDGMVSCRAAQGQGLRQGPSYQLRPRQGGEKMQQGRTRTLKNLLQEAEVPPWLRDRLPLVVDGSQVAAIAALPAWRLPMAVADGYRPAPSAPAWQVAYAASPP